MLTANKRGTNQSKKGEDTLLAGNIFLIKARSKFRKYKEVIGESKEFVPFVIETQGS